MGGASSCGADYSPAGSMFAVDEALFTVLTQVREEHAAAAAAQGRAATEAELSALLSQAEWKAKSGAPPPSAAPAMRKLSLDEVNEQAATMQQKRRLAPPGAQGARWLEARRRSRESR